MKFQLSHPNTQIETHIAPKWHFKVKIAAALLRQLHTPHCYIQRLGRVEGVWPYCARSTFCHTNAIQITTSQLSHIQLTCTIMHKNGHARSKVIFTIFRARKRRAFVAIIFSDALLRVRLLFGSNCYFSVSSET